MNDQLQRDLLESNLPDGFREQLLDRTLSTARWRRRRHSASILATFAFLALVTFQLLNPPVRLEQAQLRSPLPAPKTAHETIRTAPFTQVLHTTPLPAPHKITTFAVARIHSLPAHTTGLIQISDERLFALFGTNTVALLPNADGAELIFLATTPPPSDTASTP